MPAEGSSPSSSIARGSGVIGKHTVLRRRSLRVRIPPPVSVRRKSARDPNGRGGSLKKSLGAGSTPAARITRARVAQAGRGGVLKPRRLRVRVSPRASHGGVCKWIKRPVLQTGARRGFAGSSPATPARIFHVGRSSKGRALRCERSTLRVRIPPADLYKHTGR